MKHAKKKLTVEESTELFRAMANGDKTARDTLITDNIDLAYKIANQYHDGQQADLESEALVGLCMAVDTFDPSRGVAFSTHAQYAIKARIQAFRRDNYSLVRLCTTEAKRKIFFRMAREQRRISAIGNLDKVGVNNVIAKILDVDVDSVNEMSARMMGPESSLDASSTLNSDEGQGGRNLHTTLADNRYQSPEEYTTARMEQAQAASICEAFESTLTDRELVIWNDRILLDGSTSATITGEKLGLTKQRVGQIEKDLRARFKAFARKELAD